VTSTSEPSTPAAPPSLIVCLCVALLSAAVLGFEIALTRVFSVLLRYHFAFLAISVAVCGLGVGGYIVHWRRRRGAISLPLLCALFALAVAAALLFLLRGLFALFPDAYWLAAVAVLVPFTLAGGVLAELFARHSHFSGRLYAWDLAGAALAAIGIVGVLQLLSAIDACLFAAALGALAGVGLAERSTRRAAWLLAPALTLALLATNARWRFLDIPAVPPRPDAQGLTVADRGITQPLFTELGTPGHTSRIVDTRWNAFARTDVVLDSAMPHTFYLYTNGNVPTNMMEWNGELSSIPGIAQNFPLSDWVFSIAPLNNHSGDAARGRVLSIGPGGGLDALLALGHGAERFDGAEINPSIVELMNEPRYAKFNGGLYHHPSVRVQTAEGRAFVREAIANGRRYDLIFSALTKTATAGQGIALLESFVYTTDAFNDYLNALRDDGQLTIVLDNAALLARFWATAMTVLQQRGLSAQAAMQHIAIMHEARPGPYVFALVVQKKPFARAQTFQLDAAARRRGLEPIWIPHQDERTDFGPYPAVAKGEMTTAQFITWFGQVPQPPLDISPCPDDRPFVLDLSFTTLPIFKQLTALTLVLGLGLALLGWKDERAAPVAGAFGEHALFLGYFLCLGVGFMLVEIPLLQHLILPLGYPTLSLTVILFSILLGGGTGAWFSQRFESAALWRWAIFSALGVATLTALAALFLLDYAAVALLALGLPQRCALTALALLPLGFFLGAPFPSGLRLFARRSAPQIPLVWGLNGVASVAGSLLAAMGAKNFGFTVMLLVGAGVYTLAAGVLWWLSARRHS
jgi:hypothetical protein